MNIQLLHYIVPMGFDGTDAEEKFTGNGLAAKSFGD